MEYTTTQAVADYLGIELSSLSADEQTILLSYIKAMSEYIRQTTGQDFTATGGSLVEKRLDGSGTDTLYLPVHVKEISEITLGEGGTPMETTDYLTYPAGASLASKIVLVAGVWPKGYQNVYITGKWGAAKDDITFAATVLAAGAWNSRGSDSEEREVSSITVGRYSVSYTNETQEIDIARVKEILQLNKRYSF